MRRPSASAAAGLPMGQVSMAGGVVVNSEEELDRAITLATCNTTDGTLQLTVWRRIPSSPSELRGDARPSQVTVSSDTLVKSAARQAERNSGAEGGQEGRQKRTCRQ